MKKVFQTLSIFLVLVTMAFAFMGCDPNEKLGPTDTWCYKVFDYNDTAKFDAYCYYATEAKTLKSGSETISLVEGLNIIITNESMEEKSSSSILDKVTGYDYAYYQKSFAVGDTMEVESSDDDAEETKTKTLTFKKLYWNIFYLANTWNESYTDTTVPFVKNGSKFGATKTLKDGFNFTKVLKKMAANKLLSLLED